MKNQLLRIIAFCLALSSIGAHSGAQPLPTKHTTLTWTPDLKDPGSAIKYFLITDDSTIYSIRRKTGRIPEYSINSISPDLTMGEEKDLVYEYDKDKLRVTDVIALKNQLVCLASNSSGWSTNADEFLFAIDRNTKEISGPVQKFSPSKYGYQHVESRDKSKMLIFVRTSENSYHFELYDEMLKRLWMKDATLTPDEGEFTQKNVLLADDGDIYLYGDVEVKKDKSKGSKTVRYPMIFAVANNGTQHQQKVNLEDQFISAYDIILNSSGELKCAGFYSVDDYWHTQGAFDITYGSDLQIMNQKTTDITSMIKSKLLPPDKQDQALVSLPIIYIGEQKNGDLVIVGQPSSVRSYSASKRLTYSNPATGYNPSSTASPSSTTIMYHCSAAVVVRFDRDNEVKFTSVVPMNQQGELPEYLGCAVQNSNDRIFFVYNDAPENEKVLNQYEMKKYFGKRGDSQVMLAVVNPNGTVEKFPLANKDLEAPFIPQRSFTISEQKLLVYGDRMKTYRLGLLTFK